MQTPIEIDYPGMDAPPRLTAGVRDHIAGLEKRFGRITSCRVMVRQPSQHHRTGGLFHIAVHLTLPGGSDVNVARTPPQDERFADLDFAVNDAFRRARRQLQDRVRKMQGKVKLHAAGGGRTTPA